MRKFRAPECLFLICLSACTVKQNQPIPESEILSDGSNICRVVDVMKKNPTGVRSADGTKIYCGERISIEANNVPLGVAISRIFSKTEISWVSTVDLSSLAQVRFRDTPWDQALDALLDSADLGYETVACRRNPGVDRPTGIIRIDAKKEA